MVVVVPGGRRSERRPVGESVPIGETVRPGGEDLGLAISVRRFGLKKSGAAHGHADKVTRIRSRGWRHDGVRVRAAGGVARERRLHGDAKAELAAAVGYALHENVATMFAKNLATDW